MNPFILYLENVGYILNLMEHILKMWGSCSPCITFGSVLGPFFNAWSFLSVKNKNVKWLLLLLQTGVKFWLPDACFCFTRWFLYDFGFAGNGTLGISLNW